jgi:phage-related protein (TIGR01555 family)
VWLPRRMRQGGWHDTVLRRAYHQALGMAEVDRTIRAILYSFSQIVLKSADLAQMAASNPERLYERLALLRAGMDAYGIASTDMEAEELVALQRSVAGLADLYDRAAQALCATARMPLVKLFGTTPSGLSTDDAAGTRNWNGEVSDHQTGAYRPLLERLVRYLALSAEGPTGGREPEEWSIEFAPIDEPTEKEQAATRLTVAQTDNIYLEWGVYDPQSVRDARSQPKGYLLPVVATDPILPPVTDEQD